MRYVLRCSMMKHLEKPKGSEDGKRVTLSVAQATQLESVLLSLWALVQHTLQELEPRIPQQALVRYALQELAHKSSTCTGWCGKQCLPPQVLAHHTPQGLVRSVFVAAARANNFLSLSMLDDGQHYLAAMRVVEKSFMLQRSSHVGECPRRPALSQSRIC